MGKTTKASIIEAIKLYEMIPYNRLNGVSVTVSNLKIKGKKVAVADIIIEEESDRVCSEKDVEYSLPALKEIIKNVQSKRFKKEQEDSTEEISEKDTTTPREPKASQNPL